MKPKHPIKNPYSCTRQGPALDSQATLFGNYQQLLGQYVNGKREGKFKAPYGEEVFGTAMKVIEYKNDKKNGEFKIYYNSSGVVPGILGQYKNDQPHGLFFFSGQGDLENSILFGEEIKRTSCVTKKCKDHFFTYHDKLRDTATYSTVGEFVKKPDFYIGAVLFGTYGGSSNPLSVVFPSPKESKEILGLFTDEFAYFPKLPEECPIDFDGFDRAGDFFYIPVWKKEEDFCLVTLSPKCRLYGWIECREEKQRDKVGRQLKTYKEFLKESPNYLTESNEAYESINGKKINLKEIADGNLEDYQLELDKVEGEGRNMWGKFHLENSGTEMENTKSFQSKSFWIKLINEDGTKAISWASRGY
jgi:hypothetical protein